MSEPHPQVARINALTRNARNTWFALLGALIFAGVTLGQIKPIDFYGVGRMTELPLVSVSVPTPLFFWAAPFLVTAIYGFFHLYLIRLWDALGTAPAWIGQARLADEIQPWLVSDGALHTRAILRKDGCAPLRALEWPATLLNFALAWAFGPVVLGFMWWQSMAARELWMTAVSGGALALCTVIGMASLLLARQRMGRRTAATPQVLGHWAMMSIILVAAITVPPFTWSRTSGSARQLAPLVLTGEQITLRPDGWLPPGIAKREALSSWCKREAPDNCKSLTPNEEAAFESEWNQRRRTQTAGLRKPAINPLRFDDVERKLNEALGIRFSAFTQDTPGKRATFDSALDLATKGAPDFRRADLRDTFLTGANLLGANMQGVQAVTSHGEV